MHRLLVISNAFYPSGGVSVIRTAKFVKHLPEFGWRPIVLCADPGAAGIDPSIYAGLPDDLPVYRTLSAAGPVHRECGLAAPPAERVSRPESAIRAWLGKLCMPDDRMPWIPLAARVGVAACRRHAVDAVYATSPPAANLVAAARIARLTGLPLLLDYRDPWCAGNRRERPRRLYKRWEPELERRCVRQAAAVVTVNDAMAAAVRQACPEWDGPVEVIPNGVDADDVQTAAAHVAHGRPTAFRIVHTGKLPFAESIDALERLARAASDWARADRRPPVEIVLAGRCPAVDPSGWLLRQRLSRFGVRVSVLGQVPYAESLRLQHSADVLLLYAADRQVRRYDSIRSKCFEYAAIGRPVLALAPDGSMAQEFVRSTGIGAGADSSRPESIGQALRDLADWRRPTTGRLASVLELHDRRNLTRRLAKVLDRIAKTTADPRTTLHLPVRRRKAS